MKRSLSRQLILIISGIVAGAIAFCLILNISALSSVYQLKKEKKLEEAFTNVSQASENGSLYEDNYKVTLDNLTSNGNIRIVVMDSSYETLVTNVRDEDVIKKDFREAIFHMTKNDRVVKDTGNYKILIKDDKRLGQKYLTLWGTMEDGNLVLLRTPLESIRESSKIASLFLLTVGVLAVILASIVGIFASRRITRPLMMLTDISEQMVDLNFEARYVRGAWKSREWKERSKKLKAMFKRMRAEGTAVDGNEIDILGDHMNRLSANLETTISELKSANLQLQSDIQKKTEIDEMRKEFLSNVSHELKTPLALIQGYAEGLKECVNDDEESRNFYCEVIMDEADKMNQMVKKLLTLNQLEFGNDQVTMERFDISELIRGVAKSTEILRRQKEISLELDIPDQEYVWGDEFKIEEVMTNYMSNAINHCEGEHKIRIFYTQMDHDILRISVFNTGKNIPGEDLDRVWIKFYKVDKARTRAYGGSGIGLSIVKAIMDSHGQKCGVKNHPDGVEFWLELSQK